MVKIYKQPFAHGGDTIAIPDASQPDGKLSSTDGWTPDYQLPKTDPNYKPVGRQEMNGVFKEVTEALGQVQVQGSASWSADGAPYPINAQLYHNGKQWLALRANSVAPTDGADWAAIGTAATRDVTSITDTTAGRLMVLGTWGFGGASPRDNSFDANDLLPGQRRSWSESFTEADAVSVNLPALGGNPTAPRSWHVESMGSEPTRAVQYATEVFGQSTVRGRTFVRVRHDTTWHPWQEIIRTGSLLQATGSSTVFPMSQKAVSDLFASMQPQPSIAGSCTTNGTTDNTLVLTGIVSALALEVGDVIQISGSTGGLNDKLLTVESITDDNSIIVNYEHAGNRGNGSLKLADQTATVTVTRTSKWYNAPVGLGQDYVDVSSFITHGVQYVSLPNRDMVIIFNRTSTANVGYEVRSGGTVIYDNSPTGTSNVQQDGTVIIKGNSTYMFSTSAAATTLFMAMR